MEEPMESKSRLRIALQKSGRLSQSCFHLLSQCGLHLSTSKDELFCQVQELPIDLLLVRDDDIPGFVAKDVCDLGFVGKNVFEESLLSAKEEWPIEVVLPLSFSRCRLSLAVPEGAEYNGPQWLEGKKIATSYPAILGKYLEEHGVQSSIVRMEGSVEVAPRLRIAQAVCDIVSTGATLMANGLKEVATIMESQALLIGRSGLSSDKKAISERLLNRILGVLKAENSKYIMLHTPRENLQGIIDILPGAESPTVLQLSGSEDKLAVHAVCREDVFWETMEELKKAGASAILVLPIEKMLD